MGFLSTIAAESGGLLSEIPGLEIVTDLVVHAILIGSTAAVIWIIVQQVREDPSERAIRTVAVFTGALIVVGAEAAGVSYTSFIVDTLSIAKPLSFGFFAVILPGLVGTALAWFINANVKRDRNRAIRILVLVLTLGVTQFLIAYVDAVTKGGLEVGSYAVPNISFVVGVFLFMIFRSPTDTAAQRSGGPASWLDWLRPSGPDDAPSAPEAGNDSERGVF